MKKAEYTCTFDWLIFCIGAIRTLSMKCMCANVDILPIETFSAVDSFLLDIVSFVLTSSGAPVLLCLCFCLCCCSSNVITLLLVLGNVASPKVFRVSRVIAETEGCTLRKF